MGDSLEFAVASRTRAQSSGVGSIRVVVSPGIVTDGQVGEK